MTTIVKLLEHQRFTYHLLGTTGCRNTSNYTWVIKLTCYPLVLFCIYLSAHCGNFLYLCLHITSESEAPPLDLSEHLLGCLPAQWIYWKSSRAGQINVCCYSDSLCSVTVFAFLHWPCPCSWYTLTHFKWDRGESLWAKISQSNHLR